MTYEQLVELVAKSICGSSGELWRVGTYEAATGPNFEMEQHQLDPYNNHWRYKAEKAIATIRQALGKPDGYRYWDDLEDSWLLCGTDPTDFCAEEEGYSKPGTLYDISCLTPKDSK